MSVYLPLLVICGWLICAYMGYLAGCNRGFNVAERLYRKSSAAEDARLLAAIEAEINELEKGSCDSKH
jgi:hypothetical protein